MKNRYWVFGNTHDAFRQGGAHDLRYRCGGVMEARQLAADSVRSNRESTMSAMDWAQVFDAKECTVLDEYQRED